MKPRTKRLVNLITLLCTLAGCLFVIFDALQDNIVFYVTPTELQAKKNLEKDKTLRIGGYVKEGTFKISQASHSTFVLTDFTHDITVTYQGVLPSLFREGQGAVAEGTLDPKTQIFTARQVLAKHDENYKPPQRPQNRTTQKDPQNDRRMG